jgi:hypothetical protein
MTVKLLASNANTGYLNMNQWSRNGNASFHELCLLQCNNQVTAFSATCTDFLDLFLKFKGMQPISIFYLLIPIICFVMLCVSV